MTRARLDLLDSVAALHLAATSALAEDVGRPSASVRRDLHLLAGLGLVECRRVRERLRLWYPTRAGLETLRKAA